MLRSAAFRALSMHGVKLLAFLTLDFRGTNNGSLVMLWEGAREYGFTSKTTFYKVQRELEEKGFIEKTKPAVRRGKATAARWALTWQPINEPVGDVKHDAAPSAKPSNQWKEWTPQPRNVRARKKAATPPNAANSEVQICT